jgi:UDP-N-acetylglucosamine--N-acetylmuramyl-(pentapeptide) pyrophosphoryl-undecaprenol N-acetylglucosamine transferase
MIAQRDLTPETLRDRLAALLAQPDLLNHTALAARTIARPDAAARLADLVEELMPQEAKP